MKKLFPLFCLFFAGTAVASAQQNYKTLLLWNSSTPAPDDNRITAPETLDSEGRAARVTRPEIYVYLPRQTTGQTPAVLICPGGGYGIVATEHEGHDYARFLAENGVAGIVLKYRLPNGVHTVPLTDARRAMEIVHDSARRWNIDRQRIGVSGFSAGGHLASTLAAHPAKPNLRPAYQILFYPVITFIDSNIRHDGSRMGLTGGDPALDDYYSAERNVDKHSPPALFFVNEDDAGVPSANSYLLRDSMLLHGIPARVVSFPYGGHGWGFGSGFDCLPEVKREVLEFIAEH